MIKDEIQMKDGITQEIVMMTCILNCKPSMPTLILNQSERFSKQTLP